MCTKILIDYLVITYKIVDMPKSTSIDSNDKKVIGKTNYWLHSTVLLEIMCLLLLIIIVYCFMKQRSIAGCSLVY